MSTEARQKNVVENQQRDAWLEHKGMDTFDAMQMYIDKVNELAKVYKPRQISEEKEETDKKE